MKVEIWSDVACPFCYIGKHRFEEGLSRFEHKDDVTVEYRSFQLDPHAPSEPERDLYDVLARKFGISREQAVQMNVRVAEQGRDAGIDFHFDDVIPSNTRDAHRLIKFAGRHGKERDVVERLFEAYFTSGRNVADPATLADIAEQAGLDRGAAEEMLRSGAHADEVEADGLEASRLGARGVPFFVINRKYGVSGAQPSSVFLDVLRQAWQDEHPLIMTGAPDTGDADGCEDGACKPNN
jgi:Predicted dithiol-disulfide isomerase involved in polyketide biosynthesis